MPKDPAEINARLQQILRENAQKANPLHSQFLRLQETSLEQLAGLLEMQIHLAAGGDLPAAPPPTATPAREPVFTRAQLLEQVWGDTYYDDHVVEVHVGNLRKKIEDDPARPRFVETVRGVGYRFGVAQ
ncbi:MAG TPA: winged helix-turn-helix domain-containing protein [Anaerolinea sp.]|nr:winged helix-turn-helix domain-containing protein [Anaerolinea sp.]